MRQALLHRWSNPEVILVATNLVDGPALMLHAISQARISGAKVLLVHVIRPAYLRANPEHGLPFVLPGPALHRVQDRLNRMVSEFRHEGVLCEPIVLKGLPSEQVPPLVKTRNVDRVLVATRSAGSVERLIEGSVAEEMMGALDVPVCVIGNHVQAPKPDEGYTGRVFFATSLRSNWEEGARLACNIAEFRQANLTLLHVLSRKEMTISEGEEVHVTVRRRLSELVDEEAQLWCRPAMQILEGDPATEILAAADFHPQDFIIMGAPSSSAVERLLGASVVHRVVAGARCPVITLKRPVPNLEANLYESSGTERAMPN